MKNNAEPNAPALTIEQVIQIQKDLENIKPEEIKISSTLSKEQQRKDGMNKDKKRALENMKKVFYVPD